MEAYWSSLVSGGKVEAAAIVSDMVPVLGLVFGLILAERVAHMFLGLWRR